MKFQNNLLKELPESSLSSDYDKAMDIFNKSETGSTFILDVENVSQFRNYLWSISKIKGKDKIFTSRASKKTITVWCLTTQNNIP